MRKHLNRSAGNPARNPSPAEVRAARDAAGLTQAQAAALVHATARNWQQWEQEEGSNTRRMHPGLWELFGLKVARLAMLDALDPADRQVRHHAQQTG